MENVLVEMVFVLTLVLVILMAVKFTQENAQEIQKMLNVAMKFLALQVEKKENVCILTNVVDK